MVWSAPVIDSIVSGAAAVSPVGCPPGGYDFRLNNGDTGASFGDCVTIPYGNGTTCFTKANATESLGCGQIVSKTASADGFLWIVVVKGTVIHASGACDGGHCAGGILLTPGPGAGQTTIILNCNCTAMDGAPAATGESTDGKLFCGHGISFLDVEFTCP